MGANLLEQYFHSFIHRNKKELSFIEEVFLIALPALLRPAKESSLNLLKNVNSCALHGVYTSRAYFFFLSHWMEGVNTK